MRLILSRKGFDSASGGCPSPVLCDGSFIALPIPDRSSMIPYASLSWQGHDLGLLTERLTKGKQQRTFFAHLDPDVRPEMVTRARGWRPLLGQEGSSQSHLRNQGVGPGDLFLFWGLFQSVDAGLRFVGKPFHAIWGWLQVDKVVDVRSEVLPRLASAEWAWAAAHPHVTVRPGQKSRKKPNVLYVGRSDLQLPGLMTPSLAGAGAFPRMAPELKLTAEGGRTSRWSLPGAFLPRGRTPLTYHRRAERWSARGSQVLLQTVGRGQEFVLDLSEYPEVLPWVAGLLRQAA